MNNQETVMKHYENGREIFTIARKTGLTEREVLAILHQFVRENSTEIDITSPKHINEKLANILRQRHINDIEQKQIAKELDVPIYPINVVCNKATEHQGSKASFEEKYELIGLANDIDFNKCPYCNYSRIHKADSFIERSDIKSVYCERCENEHFILDGFVYKVNFEYID